MRTHAISAVALGAGLACVAASPALAGSAVEQRLERLEQEVRDLRSQRAEDQQTIQGLQRQLDTVEATWQDSYREIEEVQPRSEEDLAEANFMLTGYGAFTYFDRDGGDEFGADNGSFQLMHFNPIIHYRMGERLTWVTELEFELGGEFEEVMEDGEIEHEFANELELAVEYSYLDYEVNDKLIFRAGKFFTPLGIFNERLHPSWINKLPTRPVPYTGPTVLLPMTDVGIMARGAHYVGEPLLLNYAVALTNGPVVTSGGHGHGGGIQGAQTDNNNDKAWSGRLGIIPYPGFEFGVSGMTGAISHDGKDDYQALVVDGTVQLFNNMLDLRGEYMWTEQEQSGFHDGEPLMDIDREGWWIQAAHRFGWVDNEWVMPLEAVARYGEVTSDEFEEDDRENLTVGLNYYVLNNFIFRIAYDWYDGNTDDTRQDLFTMMLTYGF